MNKVSFRKLAFLLCGFWYAAAFFPLAAESSNPKGILTFSVKVSEENAVLYSSPGEENSYETGRLHAGDLIEVCYKTNEGWCALRPPEGSFSWVNGDYVLRSGSDTGTIVCPDSSKEVPVRVGADSITKSTDVQVGLQNGRQVRIIGEQTLTGNKKWIKIAPPRGEFRWIHEKSLEKDEHFGRIPNHLTRYEELLAQNKGVTPLPAEHDPEKTSRLQEEIINPADLFASDPIRNVSFDDRFSRELSGIYNDLFSVIDDPVSTETIDILAKRASALALIASNETQRDEAQKLFEKAQALYNKLESQASLKQVPLLNKMQEYEEPKFERPQTAYPYPSVASSNAVSIANAPARRQEPEPILFAVPGSEGKGNGTPAAGTPSREAKPNKMRFAFAPKENTEAVSSNGSASAKRKAFSAKPSAIVPPANYSYPAPAMLKIAPQDSAAETQNKQPDSSPAAVPQRTDHPEGKKTFLAENEPQQASSPEIRQVSAYFVKPSTVEQSAVPAADTDSEPNQEMQKSSVFQPVQGTANTPVHSPFGAMGTLGFLPNNTNGTPPYAIVSQNGNQVMILCYVLPQPGKSLDPFVGKKVGIDGTRGWFNKEGENRKMIVAERVQILK